jgi:hypothetical protein
VRTSEMYEVQRYGHQIWWPLAQYVNIETAIVDAEHLRRLRSDLPIRIVKITTTYEVVAALKNKEEKREDC